ncbi:CP family cyanate transporter-like MFS transporter [Onishia taeanensis]|uniref:CP family cyanate transporter-like MFS transporter n=1 Tax=Onishia taeanensis TaxID=284577 RepID=A0A328XQS7_9GAMM|nr:MFS transporter [Halomonas taeanensis]RAR61498.1 CP family cyanate transporter-like MFS transporter [Halomonas taeanensis]
MTNTTTPRTPLLGFLLLMILVGINLRPALSSLAPVLARIQADTGLSPTSIGALTTLPVVCLGLFAPLAPWLAKRVGAERALSLALVLLALALSLRASTPTWLLFLGTLLAGGAIGIAGSLLPALVKRELPQGADLMTGVYTMALCLGGAMGAGLSIPLADALGSWRLALGSWALIAVMALVVWRWRMPHPWPDRQAASTPAPKARLLKSALAWQVTLLMGSMSSLAYIVFGWLPVLLQRRGLSEQEAGWLLAISVMFQLVSAIGAPWLARLGRDQRPALLLMLAANGAGMMLLLLGPVEYRWPGVVLLGLGQGGCFSMALTLVVLRSGDSRLAGKLSGMAQGIGYCLAALGPLGIGILLDRGATLPQVCLMLGAILMLAVIFALFAGRNRRLEFDGDGQLVTKHRP